MYKVNQHLKPDVDGIIRLPDSFLYCKGDRPNEFYAWKEGNDLIIETTILDPEILAQKTKEWEAKQADNYSINENVESSVAQYNINKLETGAKKFMKENTMRDEKFEILTLIKEVEELNNNTPEGYIVDGDTILTDLIESNDFELSGMCQDIFNIWKNSTDKKSVEQMFFEFTDVEFVDFLKKCKEEISREE